MYRKCIEFLNEWLISPERKPLVIRGARQVGKTWVVHHLAELHKFKLIELNFERKPELKSLFSSNDPNKIILNLTTIVGDIDHKKSILFLDEIQAVPELFAKLRWFAEDMPELPVIAAGSLLEFVLEQHTFSMPVGRINYMHLEPFSFEEFLLANSQEGLVNYIKKYQLAMEIPIAIHEELMTLFKEYMIVGGMPLAIKSWITNKSLNKVSQIHNDLIATYRTDFSKYSGRLDVERLDEVMMAVPLFLGKKFIYSKVNPAIQSNTIKQILNLLFKARICYRVAGTSANGLPLGAEAQERYNKIIFLDVGLCSTILGLSIEQLDLVGEIDLINKGGIAEQIVGQLLRTNFPFYMEPLLYYWHREEKGSSAEVDYVIQHKNRIVPIEVKAGSSGSLKSLHLFMDLKNLSVAVRASAGVPSNTEISVKDYEGKSIKYKLLSVPYYLLEELPRLLDI